MPLHKRLTHFNKVRSSICMLLLTSCIAGCGNNMETINFFDRQELPDNTIKRAHIQRSESGRLQLQMDAPVIEQYSKPESKTVYPRGVCMHFFDDYNSPTAILKANYAISYDGRNLMQVRDSVVIIDLRSGDTTYLQDLTWDANQHRIFTDKPLRSKNGQRVTYGDGFTSDENMETPQILHQRGTLEWKED